jgi:hypothetical protein
VPRCLLRWEAGATSAQSEGPPAAGCHRRVSFASGGLCEVRKPLGFVQGKLSPTMLGRPAERAPINSCELRHPGGHES